MLNTTITLPFNQVGEPAVDLNDLFRQFAKDTDRFALTVRRVPGRNHHHRITVNGKSI